MDPTVPHSARVWNYWMGGKDNYPADRAAGEEYRRIYPTIAGEARQGRAFLQRAVTFLARDAGMRQFLDVGTGMPTANNTHEVAQSVAPESSIVYVDNDPLVLAHATALLTSSPEGFTDYVHADLHEPDTVLDEARQRLDFTHPVALMLMGVMGHVPDPDAHRIVRHLVAALPSGSYLALYDGSTTDPDFVAAQDEYNATAPLPYHLRDPDDIAAYFDGLELQDPGVVAPPHWRPTTIEVGDVPTTNGRAGIAHKR